VETWGADRGHDTRRATTDAMSGLDVGAPGVLLDRTFGREEITEVRHEVAARVAGAGLAGDRLHGFVLAVNEVITNVVLHAGGRGRLVLRVAAGVAYCEVNDEGPGIPERFHTVPAVPGTSEVGGRGIWLAYQLCDAVVMHTGGTGTTVQLRIVLPERESASGVVDSASSTG
jgi:anti-sigma regulatory factor (Ser/Thr protein kinase)